MMTRIFNRGLWITACSWMLALWLVRPMLVVRAGEKSHDHGYQDDQALARLFHQDQTDRLPPAGKTIDWSLVAPRDLEREKRVKELYQTGGLKTGMDYYRAAMILQHASKPEDYLLAHEFCIVSVSKGVKEALWLAAATEDRFLMSLKRPQRFGTQYSSYSKDGKLTLYQMEDGVTDTLRLEFTTPTLKEATAREAMVNSMFKP